MHRKSCGEGVGPHEGQYQDSNCQATQRRQNDTDDKEEEQELSRHALHSTWEDIYQRELEAAATRRAYAREQGRGCSSSGSVSSSRSSSVCSQSSDDDASMDGDEWFGPECAKIASWSYNTLKKQHNNPLEPYFHRFHALHSKETSRNGVSHSECSSCCPWMSEDYLSLPMLDVGCGGGHFLARLRRHGFRRLAGIDYSASAIRLAKVNLLHSKTKKNKESPSCHICLRQADLRDLKPCIPVLAKAGVPSCLCCCNEKCEISGGPIDSDGKPNDETERQDSSCACGLLQSLPPFPIVFDKGTFDVFWLMHAPDVYVQCLHRLMPRYGLLFLTSCNCTVDELDSFFCSGTGTKQEQPETTAGPGGCGSLVKESPDQQSAGEMSRLTTNLASMCLGSSAATAQCDLMSPASSHAFERIDLLPHRSFKFGGVEGQVVTSVLLRRL